MITFLILSFILAYFVGAIPTGYLICKLVYGADITQFGSGNIGATNFARVKGKFWFIPIFLIDAGKAFLSVYFVDWALNQFYGYHGRPLLLFAVAFFLLIGNAYSAFIGFRGGKGVATTLGIMAYFFPITFLMIFIFAWILFFAVTKQAFIASIGAMFIFLCVSFLFSNFIYDQMFFIISLFLWLIFRHQKNIEQYF